MLTALCGFFLALTLLSMMPGWTFGTHEQWAIPAALCGAWFALKSAWSSIREKSLDVNLLMVLAAIGAIIVNRIEDAAVLLFLFSLSSTMEAMAMSKTQSAIEALVRLRPDEAIRLTDNGDERVAVTELKVGDSVRVLPFEPVPTDGTLTTERATINEAAMTGESVPVERVTGGKLMAGTQNLDSMLVMKVTHAVGDSTLDKIVALVQEAQDNKASGERISKWFGERYTIFVVAAFCLSLGIRLALHAPFADAFYSSLILLVALSPCALVISSPAASLSALAYAARHGILVRGGEYLEEAGRITRVALDKTGTLTAGLPKVVEVCVHRREPSPVVASATGEDCDDGHAIVCWHQHEDLNAAARQAIKLAASAEAFSTHPIAEAIVAYASEMQVPVPEATSHQAFAGLGVEAEVEGAKVRVGQLKFFGAENLPAGFEEHVEEMRSRGITAVLLKSGDEWAAIGLRDEPRPEAAGFVKALRDAGVQHVAMLTGDNEGTANAVAEEVGITEIYAALMPEDKQKLIQNWLDNGDRVMMVGDGVNDAPALTLANLGIAMGGLGSEVALRAADVVLVQDRISLLPQLIKLGRMTNSIIRVNLLFAAGVILALTISSFVIKLPLPVAVIGHEGSTVLVILNGLRLLRGPG